MSPKRAAQEAGGMAEAGRADKRPWSQPTLKEAESVSALGACSAVNSWTAPPVPGRGWWGPDGLQAAACPKARCPAHPAGQL